MVSLCQSLHECRPAEETLLRSLLRTDNIQKRFQIACVLLAKSVCVTSSCTTLSADIRTNRGADPDAPDNDAKSARDNAHPAYRQPGGELNIMQEFPSTADIEDGQIYQPSKPSLVGLLQDSDIYL